MALIYIKDVEAGVRLGLWRMDEEPGLLLERYPHLRRLEMPFKSVGRQKEFLCVRALLMEMTGDDSLVIDHEESGKPVISGWNVSISHTRGYAALILSRSMHVGTYSCICPQPPCNCGQIQEYVPTSGMKVGVDIEYRSDRIVKIASHFIRQDETAGTVDQMLTLWCAKETLYKLYSEDNLHFFEMRQVSASDGNQVILENMKRGEQVTIHVTLTPEYCLTWAIS